MLPAYPAAQTELRWSMDPSALTAILIAQLVLTYRTTALPALRMEPTVHFCSTMSAILPALPTPTATLALNPARNAMPAA